MARALLAYLAVEPDRAHRRETLAALFWPDQPQATANVNLRQAIARLRRALPEGLESTFLQITTSTLQVDSSAIDLDLARFSRLLGACAAHSHTHVTSCLDCCNRLRAAATLYRGDLLSDLSSGQSQLFEEWLLHRREYLHQQALEVFATLAQAAEAAADYAQVRFYAERQLALEPWREEAHEQIMHALVAAGERVAALAQYGRYCTILDTEFGVGPSPGMVALYEHIRAGKFEMASRPAWQSAPVISPVHHSPLIGREQTIAEINCLLSQPDQRLITLTGMGGIGKTSLARQVAFLQANNYADGVWFVDLAMVVAVEQIAEVIVRTLGLSEQPGRSADLILRTFLASRRLLLILDNFEQLLAGAPLIAELLSHAPGLVVFVTSRSPLHIEGEYVYLVQPLEWPDTDDITIIARSAAVQLFVASARVVQPGFTLDPASARMVVAICRRLHGLPLAIELAASRVRLLSPATLLSHLSKPSWLDMPAAGGRDLPARQRTLRAMIDWSYQLLPLDQQALFRYLSVFVGNWTVDAACAVYAADEAALWNVLDGLDDLVRHSLLQIENGVEERRLSFHEFIRDYARKSLDANGETEERLARHAAYYTTLVQEADSQLRTANQRVWLVRIDTEYENIRAALGWAFAGQTAERLAIGAQLAGSLWYYWVLRQRYEESRRWLEHPALRNTQIPVVYRARVIIGAAFLARRIGQFDRAAVLAAEGLALARQADNPFLVALAIAVPMSYDFDPQETRRLWEEAMAAGQRAEDPWLLGLILHRGVPALTYQPPDSEREMAMYTVGLAYVRASGDPWLLADMYCDQGWAARRRGDLAASRAFLTDSLGLQPELRDPLGVSICLLGLALVAEDLMDDTEAIRLHEERLPFERGLDNVPGMLGVFQYLCLLALRRGDYVRASAYVDEMTDLVSRIDDSFWSMMVLRNRIVLMFERGQYEPAQQSSMNLLELAHDKHHSWVQSEILGLLGWHMLAYGHLERAEAFANEGLAAARLNYDLINTALCMNTLGLVAQRKGDMPLAHRLLEEGVAAAYKSGNRECIMKACGSLGVVLISIGKKQSAAVFLKEALFLHNRMGVTAPLARLLEGLAAAMDDPTIAVWLWSAANSIRRTTGVPIWPVDRAAQEERIATMRTILGDTTFQAEWAAGQQPNIVIEELVEYCELE